jgi:hypothetical protein
MPKLTEMQLAKVAHLFLANNSATAARVVAITQTDADILGVSLEELRQVEIFSSINNFAHENGRDPAELLFTLAASSVEEFDRMWKEHQVELAKASGQD